MSGNNGQESRVVLTDGRMVPPMSSAQLSAVERSRLTDAMVAQLQALTGQVNTLTQDVGELARIQGEMTRQVESLKSQQGATFNSLVEFCGRGWRGRLRWLVTGR